MNYNLLKGNNVMRKDLTIRIENENDFEEINKLVIRYFKEWTDYSDRTDVVELIEEIWKGQYYCPELSLVAEINGKTVGHFMLSHFPLSTIAEKADYNRTIKKTEIVMLAPVSVHAGSWMHDVSRNISRFSWRKFRICSLWYVWKCLVQI